jgi:hypothetical protein
MSRQSFWTNATNRCQKINKKPKIAAIAEVSGKIDSGPM